MPKREKRLSRAEKKKKFRTVSAWLEWRRKKKAQDMNAKFWEDT